MGLESAKRLILGTILGAEWIGFDDLAAASFSFRTEICVSFGGDVSQQRRAEQCKIEYNE